MRFNKTKCLVVGSDHKIQMRGIRSKDDCYLWIGHEKCQVSKNLITDEGKITKISELHVEDKSSTVDLTPMSHQKLHLWVQSKFLEL